MYFKPTLLWVASMVLCMADVPPMVYPMDATVNPSIAKLPQTAVDPQAPVMPMNNIVYPIDRDGDGVLNSDDAFPDDPYEWLDTDHDGIGNNADKDDDGDGISDVDEISAGTDPLNANSYPNKNIINFVKRFYLEVLGREADIGGLNSWVADLKSGVKTGSDIAKGFIFSEEFINKQLTDIEFIEVLYHAFFNRKGDAGGIRGWLNSLKEGTSRLEVLNGFLGSQEFKNLADRYGIIAYLTPIESFVTRFYTECLLRIPDKDGLNYWVAELKDGSKTGADIARGFVWSTEFIGRGLNNSEYLEVLYKAFFNRPADINGYNYWINSLSYGKTRKDVLEGFLGAQEFINLSNTYGIKPF